MSKIINLKSKNIIDALINVDCGQDVFEALKEVPTDNLNDMKSMIDHIITTRKSH